MNILLITNDWKPKTGGISTYLRSLVENLDHEFLKDLHIDDFIKVCEETGQKLIVSKHQGFDHGYYFINSFIEDHINYHALILKNI